MHTFFKRLFAVLLVFTLAFSCLTAAAAEDDVPLDAPETGVATDPGDPTDPTVPTEPIDPTDPTEAAEQTDESHVADMYLCYRQSKASFFGHAWVYIENRTNETLQVGAYSLPPQQGVSVGSFAFRSKALGTHYNVEAYCGNHYPMDGTVAIREALSRSALQSVSSRIRNTNFWGVFFNCAAFAATIWNAGSSRKVIPLLFPVFVELQIRARGPVSSFTMYAPDREQVYKQQGTGAGATLSRCPDGPLQKEI